MPNMDSERRSESKNGSRSDPPLRVLKSWAEKPPNFSHDLRQLLDAMRISTAPPICNMCMYMIDDNYDIDFGH